VSSQSKVRSLLDARLNAWNQARTPRLQVVWENTPAVTAETHLRAYLLPAGVDSLDLEGAHRVYLGVYQVSIVTPVSIGPGAGERIADEIAALFPVNLRLTGSGITLQVMTPVEPGPAIQEPNLWLLPVSFEVRSDTI